VNNDEVAGGEVASLGWFVSLFALDRNTVETAILTSTELPSAVFTTTESALIFSTFL